jgi:hypothetical protein
MAVCSAADWLGEDVADAACALHHALSSSGGLFSTGLKGTTSPTCG